jgi:hypothetical protein
MESEFNRTSRMAHLIYFEMVEKDGSNRRELARVALSVANLDNGRAVILSNLLNTLGCNEYQTLLSMLSLKAHAAICWDEYEAALLRQWADEADVSA